MAKAGAIGWLCSTSCTDLRRSEGAKAADSACTSAGRRDRKRGRGEARLSEDGEAKEAEEEEGGEEEEEEDESDDTVDESSADDEDDDAISSLPSSLASTCCCCFCFCWYLSRCCRLRACAAAATSWGSSLSGKLTCAAQCGSCCMTVCAARLPYFSCEGGGRQTKNGGTRTSGRKGAEDRGGEEVVVEGKEVAEADGEDEGGVVSAAAADVDVDVDDADVGAGADADDADDADAVALCVAIADETDVDVGDADAVDSCTSATWSGSGARRWRTCAR